MERLNYSVNTQKLLEELAEKNMCYWRYQGVHHNGLIPVNHSSHERVISEENPEFSEEGCSCYDNPYQLMRYMDDVNETNLHEFDVVLFVGEHMGYGLDEEDIVRVRKEEDIMYSLSAKDFFRFCFNADIYFCDKNLQEVAEENLGEDWKQFVSK